MDESPQVRQASGFSILSERMSDIEQHLRDVGTRVHHVEVNHGSRLSLLEDRSSTTTAKIEYIYEVITELRTSITNIPSKVEAMLAAHVADEEKAVRDFMKAIIAILVAAAGGLVLQIISMLHT